MKLAKLSLAAIVALGTSAFAADTLADAFKNGKVTGTVSAWYWDHDTGVATTSSDIVNFGLDLTYVTDSFNGFKMGATFQANSAPSADTKAKDVFEGDQYGSGAVLSEAYLAYTMGKTTAKAGRQYISTPLVAVSGSRMNRESFEGIVLSNTDLPATTLIAAYVQKFQGRTSDVTPGGANDADASAPDFSKRVVAAGAGTFAFDGAYTVAVINKSVPNLTLTAQYAQVQKLADIADTDHYFAEAAYAMPMGDMKLNFGLSYWASDVPNAISTTLSGDYVGAKVALSGFGGFGASFAYSTVSKDDGVAFGLGNGPTSYTGALIDGSSKSMAIDTDTYKLEVTYDFSKAGVAGLKAGAQYLDYKRGSTLPEYTTYNVNATYAVPALKGLSLTAQFENVETETPAGVKSDLDRLRLMANYKF